jgi:thymidylate synthase ThyX
VQIIKDFGPDYGYDVPQPIEEAHLGDAYRTAMEQAGEHAAKLDGHQRGLGQYALPLAYRRRALFKMSWAELAYIVELRTRPPGHLSYRQIAYDMFTALQQQHPEMAKHIRVTDPAVEAFFER